MKEVLISGELSPPQLSQASEQESLGLPLLPKHPNARGQVQSVTFIPGGGLWRKRSYTGQPGGRGEEGAR